MPACDPSQRATLEVAAITNEEMNESEDEITTALGRSVFTSAIESGHEPVEEPRTTCFGRLEIPEAEAARLSDEAIVQRLVETGVSRLSAARVVAVARGNGEVGRARPHARGWR